MASRPFANRLATNPQVAGRPTFNAGIVPVDRAQPMATDGGEARRLAEQRVSQMAPPFLNRESIVPVGQPAQLSTTAMDRLNRTASYGHPTPVGQPEAVSTMWNGGNNRDMAFNQQRMATLDRLPPEAAARVEAAWAQRADRMAARDDRRAERIAARDARKESRAARIAEIMANRPRLGPNNGLLAQDGNLPILRRG